MAELVQGSDGNFYGTTSHDNGEPGTVFRISPSGSYSNLYSFTGGSRGTNGDLPVAGLVQGSDGNFYGTTRLGGTNCSGNVFKLICFQIDSSAQPACQSNQRHPGCGHECARHPPVRGGGDVSAPVSHLADGGRAGQC